MSVEYIQYPKNELKEGQDIIQDRLASVFDFYNAQADSRLHLDNANWSYLDRTTRIGQSGLCFVVCEMMRPRPNKASIFSAEEFEYFSGNNVGVVFFNAINSTTKKSKLFDMLLYHELWHLIEKKNNILGKDMLHEGAAELAASMCTFKDWKAAMDSTANKYAKNEIYNATGKENETELNLLKAGNFWFIVPTQLLSKYCNSLSDILDEDKRASAVRELDENLPAYICHNYDNPNLLAEIFSFITEKHVEDVKQKSRDLEKKLR